jgi:predicted transcriptional regulator
MPSTLMKRFAVDGINCHSPAAPTFEYANGLNEDSTWGSAAISSGTPCRLSTLAMCVSQAAARIRPS